MESVHATHGCCGGEASAHKVAAHHCCCGGHLSRHFITKQERREALERYKEQLQKELTGVEEHLQAMT